MSYQIVQPQSYAVQEDSLVWLALYANYIRHDERAFFGIAYTGMSTAYYIFNKFQRDTIAFYLAEAQREIENELNFFIMPKWVGEDQDDPFYQDEQSYTCPISTRWGHLIEAGIRATQDISAGEAIDHTTDPAVIGPVVLPAGVTEVSEIHVYHPGTECEIPPSSIEISGGAVTIEIPRARLVLYDAQDNPEAGWDYDDTSITGPFEQTVDVIRVYNDPSTQAHLVKYNDCGEDTHDACINIQRKKIGQIIVSYASYSGGAWSISSNCSSFYGLYDRVRLNYYCGLPTLDKQMVDAVIRLAHSKMHDQPCESEYAQGLWVRDCRVPGTVSRERLNCPFGLGDGAWSAYQHALNRKLVRGSVI